MARSAGGPPDSAGPIGGDRINITADGAQESNRRALEVLLLVGKPIREPVFHYGPFVISTKSEVIQATMRIV